MTLLVLGIVVPLVMVLIISPTRRLSSYYLIVTCYVPTGLPDDFGIEYMGPKDACSFSLALWRLEYEFVVVSFLEVYI